MTKIVAETREDLARMAQLPDDRLDLAEAGLALAALEPPHRERSHYRALLADIAAAVAGRATPADTAESRVAALADVLIGRYRIVGDDRDEDELSGANLMQVLDRRRGPPLSIGLLWLHLGREQGWPMDALAFPGRALLRVSGAEGQRVIVDPFSGGRVLAVADLRDLLKASAGLAAELEPCHYAALSDREVLLRMQTSVKLRYLRHAQLARAVETVQAMLLFAPAQFGLWREAGLIHLRLGDLPAAIAALEKFVASAPNSFARHRTSALLQGLRDKLH